jgi:VIT1/CCC1 family predicted Fe2+/Mn2+ transporter
VDENSASNPRRAVVRIVVGGALAMALTYVIGQISGVATHG